MNRDLDINSVKNDPLKDNIKQLSDHFAQSPLLMKVIEAIPVPLMILNHQRRIVFSNQALTEMAGKADIQDVFGMLPGEVFNCKHATEAPNRCGTTEFCTTCGALQAINTSANNIPDAQECRIIKSDNEALDLRIYSSPLKVDRDSFTILSITDISNEKRRKNLERIFFHDLLNTASSVKALALSFEDPELNEAGEYKEHLIRMSEKLVEEICVQRDIYAAENNELNVNLSKINSFAMVKDIQGQFNLYSKDKVIIIDPESDTMNFFTDKVLLRRVLSNMMKNAVEASPGKDCIRIGCRRVNEYMEFWVHNSGYIEKNTQLQIFQRSFSTKGFDRGIGTYSMKLLCENYMKGRISFTSSPQEGTTFYCSVPLNIG